MGFHWDPRATLLGGGRDSRGPCLRGVGGPALAFAGLGCVTLLGKSHASWKRVFFAHGSPRELRFRPALAIPSVSWGRFLGTAGLASASLGLYSFPAAVWVPGGQVCGTQGQRQEGGARPWAPAPGPAGPGQHVPSPRCCAPRVGGWPSLCLETLEGQRPSLRGPGGPWCLPSFFPLTFPLKHGDTPPVL